MSMSLKFLSNWRSRTTVPDQRLAPQSTQAPVTPTGDRSWASEPPPLPELRHPGSVVFKEGGSQAPRLRDHVPPKPGPTPLISIPPMPSKPPPLLGVGSEITYGGKKGHVEAIREGGQVVEIGVEHPIGQQLHTLRGEELAALLDENKVGLSQVRDPRLALMRTPEAGPVSSVPGDWLVNR